MKKLLYISFLLLGLLSFGQEIVVSGIVIEMDGAPLPSAKVTINKTEIGTTTDFAGKYFLKVSINDTLTFSYLGMITQKINVDKDTINVQMQIDDRNFGREVVYITYMPKKLTAKNIKNVFEEEAKNNRYIVFVSDLSIYTKLSDEELKFQDKYNVIYSSTTNRYYDVNPKYLKKYNKLTFKHLKRKYKKSWLKEIRKDAIGLNKK